MKRLTYLAVWTFTLLTFGVRRAIRRFDEPDRGDVPGWVMVTVMSAMGLGQ